MSQFPHPPPRIVRAINLTSMPSSPSFLELWPAQTVAAVDAVSVPPPSPSPPPQRPRSPKRRRISEIYGIEPATGTSSKWARQLVTDQAEVGSYLRFPTQRVSDVTIAEAKSRCQFLSGNDIISCFPTSDSLIPQHEWATFVCTLSFLGLLYVARRNLSQGIHADQSSRSSTE